MKISDWLKVKLVTYVFHPLLNFHRPVGPWRGWGTAGEVEKSGDGRRVSARSGRGRMEIESFEAGILRVMIAFSTGTATDYYTYAVVAGSGGPLVLNTKSEAVRINEADSRMSLSIDRATGGLSASLDNRPLFDRAEAAVSPGGWVSFRARTTRPVRWLGIGQKTGGLFRNGRFMRLWNTDHSDIGKKSDPLYQSCPFAIALEEDGFAWGMFLDQPRYTDLKLSAAGRTGRLRCRSRRGPLAVYIVPGPTLGEVVRRFSSLTGRFRLPPLWALGHHHSRWEPKESAARLNAVARGFRERGIPLDALHVDIGHMRGYRCFTWHPDRFPDPDAFVAGLGRNGIEPVVITDPGLKKDDAWDIYSEGEAHGHYVKDASGKTFVAPVWPGPAAFPDFAMRAAAEWWGGLFAEYTRRGIAGYWIDMNEPAAFTPRRTLPGRLIHRATDASGGERSRTHDEIHNYYGWLMARATAAGLERLRPGLRSFLFTRSSYAGIQRFASSWTGDNKSNWDHLRLALPMVMNMGLCGQVMTGPDLGGFWGAPAAELLVRFIQAGTLFPFHRNHTASGTPPQEIWEFGPEAEAICAAHIRLRYELLPFLYTALRRGTATGDPVCRPLCYDFPGEPDCLADEFADTEYLCGGRLLAAPALSPGQRERRVYFPGDRPWIDYRTHEAQRGGAVATVPAPLDRLPLFVRSGSVVPTVIPRPEGFVTTAALADQTLSLDVFPATELAGELYLDDGKTLAYERGDFSLFTINGAVSDRNLTLSIRRTAGGIAPVFGGFENVQVRIARFGKRPAPAAPVLNGVPLPAATIDGDWTVIHLPRTALAEELRLETAFLPAGD